MKKARKIEKLREKKREGQNETSMLQFKKLLDTRKSVEMHTQMSVPTQYMICAVIFPFLLLAIEA